MKIKYRYKIPIYSLTPYLVKQIVKSLLLLMVLLALNDTGQGLEKDCSPQRHWISQDSILIDTIYLKGRTVQVSCLKKILSGLRAVRFTRFNYDCDKSEAECARFLLKLLGEDLKTSSFDKVHTIVISRFFERHSTKYDWIEIQEWHLSSDDEARRVVADLNRTFVETIHYLFSMEWRWYQYGKKVYFICSEGRPVDDPMIKELVKNISVVMEQ